MSEKCYRCFRPVETCYCKYIDPVETGVKFIFLMHPKEAYRQKTGTGRLAHLSLPNSEIIIGVDFTQNDRLNELLKDPSYFPLVMYPAEDAWTANGVHAIAQCTGETKTQTLKEAIGDKQLLVVLVDATWFFAKKMLRLSPNVTRLQKLSFRAGYRSEYTFKQEPTPECLSTIETCYYLIRELKEARICPESTNPEPLMAVFRRMVHFQLDSHQERIKSGEPSRYSLPGGIRERRRQKREMKEAKNVNESQSDNNL